MIDINLLNKKGVYKTNESNFNHLDEDLDKVDSNLKSNNNNLDSGDFESNYDDQNNRPNTPVSKKRFWLLIVAVAAIGLFTYYQFFSFEQSQISSGSIREFIGYILDNEDISIKQIKVDNNSIDMTFDINQTSFDKYKTKIGAYFDKMKASNDFDYMLSPGSLNIKSSNRIDIVNINFDESVDVQKFESNDRTDINRDDLRIVLDSVFNINNEALISFDITPSDLSYSYYNISFSE